MRSPCRHFTIYILRCQDGSLYTGITLDLDQRLAAHAIGKAAKYTRTRLPIELVWSRTRQQPTHARQLEWAIKKLSREQKLKLISGDLGLWRRLRKSILLKSC